MPELPEVETMVRDLRPALIGRTIRSPRLTHRDVLHGISGPGLCRALDGATVTGMSRRAKNAVIETNRSRLVIQPGMTGTMFVKRRLSPTEDRYGVLRASLDGGRIFVYHDVRRLGTIRWLGEAAWHRFSAAIGPEPLDRSFTPAVLARQLAGSRAAVKKVLMDQRRLAGVGNIYANEALFAAGVDPSKAAGAVTTPEIERLHHHLVRILGAAVAAAGTTIRDYRTGTGELGNFQLDLKVYERQGQPCVRCGTTLAATHEIDARITVFCYRCQR